MRNNYRNAASLPPDEIVLAARVRLLTIAADLDKVCLAASHVLDLPCFDTVLRFGFDFAPLTITEISFAHSMLLAK